METEELYTDILNASSREVFISATDTHLVATSFQKSVSINPNTLTEEVKSQLEAYQIGALEVFDLPLLPEGTDFQKSV